MDSAAIRTCLRRKSAVPLTANTSCCASPYAHLEAPRVAPVRTLKDYPDTT
jgi:hypothetical protein